MDYFLPKFDSSYSYLPFFFSSKKPSLRLTLSLEGGTGPVPPAQTFVYKDRSDVEVSFQFLAQDREYGKLCVIEEPLITGYTTMGRLAAQIYIQKCYFS